MLGQRRAPVPRGPEQVHDALPPNHLHDDQDEGGDEDSEEDSDCHQPAQGRAPRRVHVVTQRHLQVHR